MRANATTVQKSIQQWSVKLVKEKTVKYVPTVIKGADCVANLLSFMADLSEEHFYAVYLNAKHEPVGLSLISKGTVNASLVHPREVFKGAILANAYTLIVAHNHPSGNTAPSKEDIETTEKLVGAGNMLNITILDHLIIGNDTYSFRENMAHIWF